MGQAIAMNEGTKLIVGMTAIPVIVIAVLIGMETPLYIPSALMAEAAQANRYSAAARKQMARALYGCRKRRAYYRADEIGVRYRKISSWRNDAGWFGRTDVDCADGHACTVRATALVPAPLEGHSCSWTRRSPR